MSASSIALLPVMTAIGDYQWLTFSVMNLAFYAITAIEIDRYLYILAHQNRMYEVFALNKRKTSISTESKIVYEDLTRREIEIALGILGNLNYKKIAEDLFIAESTVSKHASNIFKKTGVKNKRQFISRFKKKSIK
nr:LuxR C-terminal-related transcriptional regulator [Allomuricauda sp.]